MKKIFALFSVLFAINSPAQLSNPKNISSPGATLFGTITIGGGLGGLECGAVLGIRNQRNWSIGYNASVISYKAQNTPEDYRPASNLLGPESKTHYNTMVTHTLMLQKKMMMQNPKWSYHAGVGPALCIHQQCEYTPVESSSSYWVALGPINSSSNYSKTIHKSIIAGFSTQLGVEYALNKKLSMQLNTFANLNTEHAYLGLQLGFIVNFPVKTTNSR